MSEWGETNLSEFADIIGGYAFKGKHFGDSGIPVVKIKDINPPFIDLSSAMRIDIEKFYSDKNLERYRLQKGDFVIAMTGATIGKIGILNKPVTAYINQRVALVKPRPPFTKEFVYYCIGSDDFQKFIQNNIDSHSAQENISATSIGQFSLNVPSDPEEQKAIAELLSSLDDKIDLLHSQNQTLESLAETLFRHTFIDSPQNDWDEKAIKEFGDVICGKTPSKKIAEYYDGNIPFIKIPDMHGKTYVSQTADTLSETGKESQNKKTLPPLSICVSCIATVGLVSMNVIESQTNQQINSIIPYKDHYRYYLYLAMKTSCDLLTAMASGGTATLNLNTGDFSRIPLAYPGEKILQSFHKDVLPYFEKMLHNHNQIKTLINLRDTLLPKLMSGEIRVQYDEAS